MMMRVALSKVCSSLAAKFYDDYDGDDNDNEAEEDEEEEEEEDEDEDDDEGGAEQSLVQSFKNMQQNFYISTQ